jgi:hypothetical protein
MEPMDVLSGSLSVSEPVGSSDAPTALVDVDRPVKRARLADEDPIATEVGSAVVMNVTPVADTEVHCSCRKPYNDVLKPPMICCDKCDIW